MAQQESMKSLKKVLDILRLFIDTRREMALSEISTSLGLNKTTVSRIVTVLVRNGFMSQKEKRGKYFLGPIFITFSGVVKSKLKIRELASPYLNDLSHELKETIIFAVKNGNDSIFTETYIDSSVSNHVLKAIPEESTSLVHSTCTGKILLANMSDETLKRYFDNHRIERRTPHTVIDIKEIKKQLETVKREGVAFDDEESSYGVRGLAVDVRDADGEIAGAVGVIAPSIRLSWSQMRKWVTTVKNCSSQISQAIGYHGPTDQTYRD